MNPTKPRSLFDSLIGSFLVLALMAMAFLAPPAKAQVVTGSAVDFGITNTITVGTITANMGSGVYVGGQSTASLELQFVSTATNVGNLTLTFLRSKDNSTWETTPKFTWGIPMNGTNLVVAWTNLPASTLGAAQWIKCIQAVHDTSSGSASSVLLSLVKKRDRNIE
jgi:hypothetical protein